MNPVIIEALLVSGEDERVRIIIGQYCLDFDGDDVLDLEEIALPHDVTEGSAIAARVTLKPGARLWRLGSIDGYREVLWSRGFPFALATRVNLICDIGPTMQERENVFFAARGLTEHRS